MLHSNTPDSTLPSDEALFDAAVEGDIEAAKTLIADGAPLEYQGTLYRFSRRRYRSVPANWSITPLAVAAKFGHIEIVKLLLAAGANPNHQYQGRGVLLYSTPRTMLEAVLNSNTRAEIKHEMIQLLLAYDFNPTIGTLTKYRGVLSHVSDCKATTDRLIDSYVKYADDDNFSILLNDIIYQDASFIANGAPALFARFIALMKAKNAITENMEMNIIHCLNALSIPDFMHLTQAIEDPALKVDYLNKMMQDPSKDMNALILARKQTIQANPYLKLNSKVVAGYDVQLRLFAVNEITRLNHRYIWNGRKKAKMIQDAINSIDDALQQAPHQDNKPNFKDLSDQFGLFRALSYHRLPEFKLPCRNTKDTSSMLRLRMQFAEIL